MAEEAAILGSVSLLLTLMNIVCIIAMAILILWVCISVFEVIYVCQCLVVMLLSTLSLRADLLSVLILCVLFVLIVVYLCNYCMSGSLQVKEVAPHTALSEYVNNFWKTDIKVLHMTDVLVSIYIQSDLYAHIKPPCSLNYMSEIFNY